MPVRSRALCLAACVPCVQEELSSLVAILHEFAADVKLLQLMESFDTNKDGKVSFGEHY
jgi:hypothetical protein